MEITKKRAARLGSGVGHPFWRSVLFGVLTALMLGAAFLFFSAFLLYRLSDPLRYFPYVAVIVGLLLSFFCGWQGARLYRKSGALTGITAGLTLAFLFLAAALILKEGALPITAIPLYLGMLLASTVGGWAATRKKARRRHRR